MSGPYLYDDDPAPLHTGTPRNRNWSIVVLLVLTVVLAIGTVAGMYVFRGSPADEAEERAGVIRRQQVSPQGAIAFLEQVWGRDLSGYDPDGPLPDVDPDPNAEMTRGRVRHEQDPVAVALKWRRMAEERQLSIRELIIEVTARSSFVGTPREVADKINEYVQSDAADGYILVPHLTPHGLDEFVAKVVPELQDRGVFRADYEGTTLRDHLGLARPRSPVGRPDEAVAR